MMQKIHRLQRSKSIIALLMLALCIRVLIPQGYMIENSGEDFPDFSVVICDGAIAAVSAKKRPSSHHQISLEENSIHVHQGHLNDDAGAPGNTSGHGDHNKGHSDCSSCGFWLASSAFVDTADFYIDDLVNVTSDNYLNFYTFIQIRRPYLHSHQSRAPPAKPLFV